MTTEAETSSQEQSLELDLDGLIRELDAASDHLPEQALRQCQAHAELVTPRLIATIEEAVRLGRAGTDRPGNAHFFALFLLTEFRAAQALPVILEAMSLPEGMLDRLFGDSITETFSRSLAVLGADHLDLIESMILSPDLDQYVRWAAAKTLCLLVREGKLTRAEALERLMRHLRAAIAAQDQWGVTIAVDELGYLNPLEVQGEIEAAFEQDLVSEEIIDWEYFEDYLLHPDRPGECPELKKKRPAAIEDTVEELRRWACFAEKPLELHFPLSVESPIIVDPFYDVPDSLDAEDDDQWERPSPLPLGDVLTIRHDARRVGRNDPCPCGSGKKYKKCCLKSGDSFA